MRLTHPSPVFFPETCVVAGAVNAVAAQSLRDEMAIGYGRRTDGFLELLGKPVTRLRRKESVVLKGYDTYTAVVSALWWRDRETTPALV